MNPIHLIGQTPAMAMSQDLDEGALGRLRLGVGASPAPLAHVRSNFCMSLGVTKTHTRPKQAGRMGRLCNVIM